MVVHVCDLHSSHTKVTKKSCVCASHMCVKHPLSGQISPVYIPLMDRHFSLYPFIYINSVRAGIKALSGQRQRPLCKSVFLSHSCVCDWRQCDSLGGLVSVERFPQGSQTRLSRVNCVKQCFFLLSADDGYCRGVTGWWCR